MLFQFAGRIEEIDGGRSRAFFAQESSERELAQPLQGFGLSEVAYVLQRVAVEVGVGGEVVVEDGVHLFFCVFA